jgi:hypothetical protein
MAACVPQRYRPQHSTAAGLAVIPMKYLNIRHSTFAPSRSSILPPLSASLLVSMVDLPDPTQTGCQRLLQGNMQISRHGPDRWNQESSLFPPPPCPYHAIHNHSHRAMAIAINNHVPPIYRLAPTVPDYTPSGLLPAPPSTNRTALDRWSAAQ